MEIKKVTGGAWLEVRPVDERIGELRLLVLPLPPDFKVPSAEDVDGAIKAFAALIVGWNIEDGGQPVPCDAENKGKYLEYLFRIKTKEPDPQAADGEKEIFLAQAVARFSSDINNFLGN